MLNLILSSIILFGTASYYSESGCIGCSPTLTMANGQRFTDEGMTIACNHVPLNTDVIVFNPKTNLATKATVTDRGGFNKLGRIADLSPLVKEKIGCSDLCKIGIIVL